MADPQLFRQAYDQVVEHVRGAPQDLLRIDRWEAVLDRLRAPDRVIQFTVRWERDDGRFEHTPAWRVQHCNALGPYKGGLRFSPHVTEDALRFLAFEQCLKNALTGLPLGGGKGGAAFRASAHSEGEVRRFCQAFVDEYVRYGGASVDVPAGDQGTGERELGWMFGRFARLTGRVEGAFTGRPEALGGVPGRTEATGYGLVRFATRVLEDLGRELAGTTLAISGAGNVALHTAERAVNEGARVLCLSNSGGTAVFADGGLRREQLAELLRARAEGRRLEDVAEDADWVEFREDERPWSLTCDVALPCATQNELRVEDAEQLVSGGTRAVVEGANMPCTPEAVAALRGAGVVVAPSKAANAGGVIVSGFEMIQDATRDPWTRERVYERLDLAMDAVHGRCRAFDPGGGTPDYVRGANLAAFDRLGRAVLAAGLA